MNRISIIRDDITQLKVDAIVNAAKSSLLGGGGVDGAIHRVAGSELLEYCKKLNGCNTGEAKITPAYDLPAKYIIHTVGPIWSENNKHADTQLANCYKNSLLLAVENNISTIAFPNISTGVYGFPKQRAAEITKNEVEKFLNNNSSIKMVFFTIFDDENHAIYSNIFDL